MKIWFAEEERRHRPEHFLVNGRFTPHPEREERIDRLLDAGRAAGHEEARPRDHGLSPAAAIHTPEYLHFLEHAHTRWMRQGDVTDEVRPNIHPMARSGSYPASIVAQAGWHMADLAAPIGAGTFEAARWAMNASVEAALSVRVNGAPHAYALCRPPGHHAYRDVAGGFCFINNSAIAAETLRKAYERVAIVDVDVHHGNGTQGCFYARPDVLTVSLHCETSRFYPFFWGYAEERGEGAGLGYNLNVPLARRTPDGPYLEALGRALERVRAFAPGALVVALGLDAAESDPFQGLMITREGFARIAERLAALKLPTVLVQEGGYLSEDLGDNLVSFLNAFEAAHAV